MSQLQKYSKVINIGHGDPTIFRKWWDKHNLLPLIKTDHHALYEYQEEDFTELTELTHTFHNLFNTDCKTASIVYGNGSTQVINAILYTISRRLNRNIVVGYNPPVYMLMHEFLSHSPWIEVTFDLTRTDLDVEIVIDPNNPSGDQRIKRSKAQYTIYDKAYNWPIYVDSVTPTSSNNNDITVYTISKCLGMGGLRLGWAFVNDFALFSEIQRSLFIIGICPNTFGMEAVKSIFSNLISNLNLLQSYIDEISNIIKQRRKSISDNPYFTVTNVSGPYAWIKSKHGNDISEFLLKKFSIKLYSGVHFGSDQEHARLSLICSDEEFNSAIQRFSNIS